MSWLFGPVVPTDRLAEANHFLELRIARETPRMPQVPRFAVCGGLRREHLSELGDFLFHERQTVGNPIELKCLLRH